MTVGKQIRIAREKAGLSQFALGMKIGVPACVICTWETTNRSPHAKYLCQLATALNVSTDYLLGHTRQIESEQLACTTGAQP